MLSLFIGMRLAPGRRTYPIRSMTVVIFACGFIAVTMVLMIACLLLSTVKVIGMPIPIVDITAVSKTPTTNGELR